MCKNIKSIVALIGALGIVVSSQSFAGDTDACTTAIGIAKTATAGTEFSGRNAQKSEDSLIAKLDSAALKASIGKYEDAVQKLNDYRNSVISMADAVKPKLSSMDAYGADGVADGQGGLEGYATDAINMCTM